MHEPSLSLPDGIVVITGASGQIGRAVVTTLAKPKPAALLLVANQHPSELYESIQLAKDIGVAHVSVVQADLGMDAALDTIDAEVGKLGLPVAGLVHLAGVNERTTPRHLSRAALRRALAVDVEAGLLLIDRLALHMKPGSGIVLIGSRAAHVPIPGISPYAAAKMALVGALPSLSAELGAQGIRINLIEPGLIRENPDASLDVFLDRIPLGRIGTPSELAAVVAFLLSHESSYVTGQVIGVSGGL
jgi:NAD(P)-dependent dehydrogenase (short-subunit alcohol dehydrogenase family)